MAVVLCHFFTWLAGCLAAQGPGFISAWTVAARAAVPNEPYLGRANQLAPFHRLEGTFRQHRYLEVVSPIWLPAGRWSPSKTSGIGQHRSLIVAVPTSPPSLHPGCPYNLARSTLRSRASHPPISGTYSSRHAPDRNDSVSQLHFLTTTIDLHLHAHGRCESALLGTAQLRHYSLHLYTTLTHNAIHKHLRTRNVDRATSPFTNLIHL